MKEPGSSSNLWFKTDAGMLVAHIGLFPPLNGTQCLDEKCNSAGLLWVDDTQATIFPSNLTSMDAQEYDKCFYLDVQFRRISGSRFCFEARRARHYICQFVCPGQSQNEDVLLVLKIMLCLNACRIDKRQPAAILPSVSKFSLIDFYYQNLLSIQEIPTISYEKLEASGFFVEQIISITKASALILLLPCFISVEYLTQRSVECLAKGDFFPTML